MERLPNIERTRINYRYGTLVQYSRSECGKPTEYFYDANRIITKLVWTSEGRLHRTNGPAVLIRFPSGAGEAEWWVDGTIHREDGPALLRWGRGFVEKEWWVDGTCARVEREARVENDAEVCELCDMFSTSHEELSNGPYDHVVDMAGEGEETEETYEDTEETYEDTEETYEETEETYEETEETYEETEETYEETEETYEETEEDENTEETYGENTEYTEEVVSN
jgi:hypothetical protein